MKSGLPDTVATATYRRLWMIDLIKQCAESQAIAQQNELVLIIRALLPGTSEVLDRLRPFRVCGTHLTRKAV